MSDQIKKTLSDSFMIEDWVFHANANRLEKGEKTIRLEPKATQVLLYLASRANQPVSREELLENVWAGMIVGDDVLTNAINKLRRAFNDDRQNPRIIETIQKTGYRLIAPVNLTVPDTETAIKTALPERQRTDIGSKDKSGFAAPKPLQRQIQNWMVWTVVLLVVIAAVFLTIKDKPEQQLQHPVVMQQDDSSNSGQQVNRQKPSLVILPFENLSNDTSQAYFVDGLTDDLISVIARRLDIFIISRDSSVFYRGTTQKIDQIAKQLNVRYVLTGSVRILGDRIRIGTTLQDTHAGSALWSENFEGAFDDIFSIQDNMIDRILTSLLNDKARQKKTDKTVQRAQNFQAYDNYLYGKQNFYLYASKEANNTAREFFRKAIEFDPNYANSYAMLAWTHAYDAMNGWSEDRDASLEKAYELSTQALQIQTDLPVAYFVRGLVNRERKEYIKGLVDAEKALEFDPNYANAHMLLGTLLYFAGEPEKGVERVREAIRLNPHHPYNYSLHLGQGLYILRHYKESVSALRSGLETNPASARMRVWLVAALAQSGEADEAEWEADQLLLENPDFSLQKIQNLIPFKEPQDMKNFMDGLRKAGLSQTLVIE